MGKLIWNGSGNLAEVINSPVSFITGANLKKKDKKPVKKDPPLQNLNSNVDL